LTGGLTIQADFLHSGSRKNIIEKMSIRMIYTASKATIFALLKLFLKKSRRKFIDKGEF